MPDAQKPNLAAARFALRGIPASETRNEAQKLCPKKIDSSSRLLRKALRPRSVAFNIEQLFEHYELAMTPSREFF